MTYKQLDFHGHSGKTAAKVTPVLATGVPQEPEEGGRAHTDLTWLSQA